MAAARTCDGPGPDGRGCGRNLDSENPLVLKLYLTPILPNKKRQDHGAYSAHADIGSCCSAKVIKGGMSWTQRKSPKEKGLASRLRA